MATRYERLLERRAPRLDRALYNFSESFERQAGEATRYLMGSMSPVAPALTRRLTADGDRVENQLKQRLAYAYPALQFRRQGSVSNNTHIKYYSDVDVLVIIDKYEMLESPQQPPVRYNGDVNQDLIDLRQCCAVKLKDAFPSGRIDNEGSTCVTLEDASSLSCSVDAVPSNWFNTNTWNAGRQEHDRGIQVYNRDKKERILNRPFLFNYRLDQHDSPRSGVPRCLIRLLKNIKADHEKSDLEGDIDFSSFDICSLVYRMPDDYIRGIQFQPLALIQSMINWMTAVINHEEVRRQLLVVDESRVLFNSKNKEMGAGVLLRDLNLLHRQALLENQGRQIITEAHLKS